MSEVHYLVGAFCNLHGQDHHVSTRNLMDFKVDVIFSGNRLNIKKAVGSVVVYGQS